MTGHMGGDVAGSELLTERVETLAAWIQELEAQLRATAVVGDGKQLKELAKALEAWNKHDPKLEERVTNRVDVLADRFETLAGTVNATANALAGKDGEIARLRRELEDGTAHIESVVRDLRQSGGTGKEVAELRKAIATLSAEKTSKTGDRRVDAISGELDVLAQRLDTLSRTVSTTAAGLAGREGELAALRSRLEDGDARADSVVRELRASLDALVRQVEDLGDRPRDSRATELFGALLDELHGKVEQLASQLHAVSGNVATASAGLARNEAELATFQRRFDEAGAQVNAMIRELRETVHNLPSADMVEAAIEEQLQTLGVQVDGAVEHVSRLEAATKARLAHATAATADLERILAEVSERLVGLEQERDTVADALGRASEAWSEERTWVRGRLEVLTAAVEDAQAADGSLRPELDELNTRVEAIEHGHETVGAELARMAAALDAEREELKTELDALATSLSTNSGSASPDVTSEQFERMIAELAKRLDDMERESTVVAAEIARTQAAWAAEIGSLESRLDQAVGHVESDGEARNRETGDRMGELIIRLEALERDRDHAPTGSSEEMEELRDLRVLINGLRMRLASSEKELAALSNSGDVSARLDDLSLRLASLERSSFTAAAVAPPVPGDGRFRVELRGLEQKMQSLEDAARENREAVLMQFERLASRLQWRVQQLEMESADEAYGPAKPAPRPLGQVVPLRGEG